MFPRSLSLLYPIAVTQGDYVVKALLGPVDTYFDGLDTRPSGGGGGGCCLC